jgi:hypothetical protein
MYKKLISADELGYILCDFKPCCMLNRLGEFSPKGDCLVWAVFLKILELAQNVWILILHDKNYLLRLTKNWVGLHFGRFLHKLNWSHCCLPIHVNTYFSACPQAWVLLETKNKPF